MLSHYLSSDDLFNTIFPAEQLGNLISHLTPVNVALAAANFLTKDGNNNIADIGSGPGKFCLIGGCTTTAKFTGIERRTELINIAEVLAESFCLDKVSFVDANINEIDFSVFDGFYLFNPFYENIESGARMDQQFPYSYKLYQEYTAYVQQQLAEMPLGTKVAAFHGSHKEIPSSFRSEDHPNISELKLFTKKFRGG